MKTVRVAALAAFFGLLLNPLAVAGKEDMQQLMQEVKAYNEKARSYMESKRSEMKALESKIEDFKSQTAANKDAKDQKAQPNPQIEQIMAQKHALRLDIVQHEVEFAQQHVTFAQRRLQIAQGLLAELQAKQPGTAASKR